MNDKKIENKVLALFSSHFGIPREDLALTLTLEKDLNTTKLELNDFYSLLETAFGINIEDTDSENFKTVGDIINFVIDHGTFT